MIVILATVCAFLGAAAAQSFWMTDAALRASFAGHAISGEYVDGRTFTERYEDSGALVYRESTSTVPWTGHWSVVRGRFCTIYDTFGTGGCFRVHQVSDNCFEFYFETRTEEEARRSTPRTPSWTARAWRTDHVPTCKERPMV
ncbi:MAG: hypothetical protein KKB37_07650 [Alphaproteobacteria bacterium]|nr:hypothetical protein [Alphaproteobacteria bacterium]